MCPAAVFECPTMGPGATVEQTMEVDEPRAAADAGPAGAAAPTPWRSMTRPAPWFPPWTTWACGWSWPDGGKHNAYVGTLFASLREEGIVGPLFEGPAGARP